MLVNQIKTLPTLKHLTLSYHIERTDQSQSKVREATTKIGFKVKEDCAGAVQSKIDLEIHQTPQPPIWAGQFFLWCCNVRTMENIFALHIQLFLEAISCLRCISWLTKPQIAVGGFECNSVRGRCWSHPHLSTGTWAWEPLCTPHWTKNKQNTKAHHASWH